MQEMADVLSEHLTQDSQMKLYRGTVLTILKKCGEELPLDVNEQVIWSQHIFSKCWMCKIKLDGFTKINYYKWLIKNC